MTNINHKPENYIRIMEMESHPEGGFFKEVYRSTEAIDSNSLPARYNTERCFGTLIYYLLKEEQKSSFHKLESDEIWHHLDGCAIEIHTIDASGSYKKVILGKDIDSGQVPQYVIPHGTWFAAGLQDKNSFGLAGCTVIPGFEFSDFKLGSRNELLNLFPQHEHVINLFTNE